jgi:hypothetical protein
MKRKNRPSIRPEGLAWLAQVCSDTQFSRILSLHDRGQFTALLLYIKSLCDETTFAQFEEKNLEPAVLAERRKVEAEKREAEEREKRTIYADGRGVKPPDAQAILESFEGKGWHAAALTQAEQAEAAKLAEEERTGFIEIPRAAFDPL